MFYRWRKLELILLAVLMANMTPEAKALPMQSNSTMSFPTPSTILPSSSGSNGTQPRTVISSILKTFQTTAFVSPSTILSSSSSGTRPRTVMSSVLKHEVSSISNTQASKIPSSPYEVQVQSKSPTLSPTVTTVTTRSIAVNSSSPTTISSISNTQASKIPSSPYEVQVQSKSPTLSPTLTTRSFAVNSSSPTMKPPITDTRDHKRKPKLIRYIGIGIGGLAVIIIIVAILCRLRWKACPRTPKSPTSPTAFDNEQFEPGDVESRDGVYLARQDNASSSPQTNYGTALDEEIFCRTESNKKESTIQRAAHQKRDSWKPGIRDKSNITGDGGTLHTESATLQIGPGCLGEETAITMLIDKDNFAFKSLVDLGLLSQYPRVIEFLPDGLKFEKPANLTVQLENLDSPELELFVLHGSYDSEMERTIWKVLPTDDINVDVNGQCVDMKINGFCFFTYIMATRDGLARILSHLNHSFNCHAVALYRRMPRSPDIDIFVVLYSEFVENPSELTKMIDENGFRRGEIGAIKRVDIHRSLEMCLEFPRFPEKKVHQFKIDVTQLDKNGMVIDYFREITQAFPATGKVVISEVQRNCEELLWTLNINEKIEEKKIQIEVATFLHSEPDYDSDNSLDMVVMRTTRLSRREINRLSQCMGVDWDSLAGLMDIPYEEREAMRTRSDLDCSLKAKMILSKFNESKGFCRNLLKKYLVEIRRDDVTDKMEQQQVDEPTVDADNPNNNSESEVVLPNTRLSPREMYRLSREIVDWESLAALMDLSMAERDHIHRNNTIPDSRSQAEKALSIFSKSKNFCRKKLGDHLKDIGLRNLMNVVETGQYRGLEVIRI